MFLALGTAQAMAAVPVEDMSTGDGASGAPAVSPQLVEPQPVLPGASKVQPSGSAFKKPVPVFSAGSPGALGGSALYGSAAPSAAAGQSGPNAEFFYELQQLRSEVLQLRGLVEDQAFEIKRLRDLQRSQYLDIDRRLIGNGAGASALVSQDVDQEANQESTNGLSSPDNGLVVDGVTNGVANGVANGAVNGVAGDAAIDAGSNEAASAGPGNLPLEAGDDLVRAAQTDAVYVAPQPIPSESVATDAGSQPATGLVADPEATPDAVVAQKVDPEKLAFDQAYELMKDQQFEQSIAAYRSLVEQFPGGSYVPESHYWLGELYLLSDRLEDARGAFTQVVDRFPAHQKVPLSLYKLGVVNNRLGGTTEALEFLDDVVVRYPDTPAAGLARTYAAELR